MTSRALTFGSLRDLADPELEEAVRTARAAWLADDDLAVLPAQVHVVGDIRLHLARWV